MNLVSNLLKVVYHLVLAFPRFFGNALSFIPYIGTLIRFLPDFLDLAKLVHEEYKDYEYEKTSRQLQRAIKALGAKERKDRIKAIRELEHVINNRFSN